MTLDEAISNAREAEKRFKKSAIDAARVCAFGDAKENLAAVQEMRQFLKWLEELKQFRERKSHWIDSDGLYICAHCGAEAGVMTWYCSECGYGMDGDAP